MKKITKLVCGVLGAGCLLAGCATVGDVKNSSNELIYNGNSAVMVDGYLYYGNTLVDATAFGSDSDYKTSAELSYLARLNTNIDLAAQSKDYSPEKVEMVSKLVAGYNDSFMFVLGNYIYYATPNRQKVETNDEVENNYNFTTFYRSKLNGDDKEKFYTPNAEVSNLEVLKYDGKYYMVMLAGEKLIKIQLGKNLKITTVAEGVSSIAIPETYQKDKNGSTLDWNGYIYYTTTRSDESNPDISGSNVNRILVSGGDSELVSPYQGKTVKFVDREKDVLFYTMSGTVPEVYKSDLTGDNTKVAFTNNQTRVYTDSSISDVNLIATESADYGYVFNNSSSKLVYVRNDGFEKVITFKAENTTLSSVKLLFVNSRTLYISTTTGIYTADLSKIESDGTVACETLVTMTAIYDGSYYAYDGSYIYYYARLEAVETEESEETEADDNYYMYRTKAAANSDKTDYELLGLAKNNDRRTKG